MTDASPGPYEIKVLIWIIEFHRFHLLRLALQHSQFESLAFRNDTSLGVIDGGQLRASQNYEYRMQTHTTTNYQYVPPRQHLQRDDSVKRLTLMGEQPGAMNKPTVYYKLLTHGTSDST